MEDPLRATSGRSPTRDRLLRVVENDADSVPEAAADAANAVPKVDTIVALRSLYRPVVDGERHSIASPQRHYFGPALHARPLLGQNKLTASEITFGFGEQDRDLQRECEVTIKVLMQAIEVARHVLQQQRRRSRL